MLSKIRCGRGLGPQILLGLAGHVLAVDQVADATEDGEEEELLHGDLSRFSRCLHSARWLPVALEGVSTQ